MNEKIKEIYNRAFTEYFGEEYKDCELDILPEDQYFAELLIRECANYAFSDDQERNTMLSHFGVE
jgi:hypothetical protein